MTEFQLFAYRLRFIFAFVFTTTWFRTRNTSQKAYLFSNCCSNERANCYVVCFSVFCYGIEKLWRNSRNKPSWKAFCFFQSFHPLQLYPIIRKKEGVIEAFWHAIWRSCSPSQLVLEFREGGGSDKSNCTLWLLEQSVYHATTAPAPEWSSSDTLSKTRLSSSVEDLFSICSPLRLCVFNSTKKDVGYSIIAE